MAKTVGYIFVYNIFLIITLTQQTPVISGNDRINRQLEQDTNGQISIGPCPWITNDKCPDPNIRFYLFTRKNVKERQLVHIDKTWDLSNISTSNYNPEDPVKIIIHGYNSDMFLTPLIEMKEEYLQRGNYNLFYIDWSDLAQGPCYISAVHNARHSGHCIAELVNRILESGQNDIHLIGFSLGAHVTNFVANSLKDYKIPRITGLDPAMPLYITASNDNKLDKSDAEFVDVIHTNALIQGKIERCGHADFYMNGGIIQPGCFSGSSNIFACSHHRSPDYYAESIRSYRGFWGWACSSYINYLLGLCPKTNYLVIAGEDCDPNTRGMFLITTNGQSPFATGRWTELITNVNGDGDNTKTTVDSFLSGPMKIPSNSFTLLKQLNNGGGKLDGPFNNKQPNLNGVDYNNIMDFQWNNFINDMPVKK